MRITVSLYGNGLKINLQVTPFFHAIVLKASPICKTHMGHYVAIPMCCANNEHFCLIYTPAPISKLSMISERNSLILNSNTKSSEAIDQLLIFDFSTTCIAGFRQSNLLNYPMIANNGCTVRNSFHISYCLLLLFVIVVCYLYIYM